MMKAWEAKATKRAANATGFTLMAVSLAACNDDAVVPALATADDLTGSGTTSVHMIQRTEGEAKLLWDGQFANTTFGNITISELFDNNAVTAEYIAPILTTEVANDGVVFGRTTSAADDQIYADGFAMHNAVIDGGLGTDTIIVNMKSPFAQPLAVVNVENMEVVNVANIYAADTGMIAALEDPNSPYIATSVHSAIDLAKVVGLQSLTLSEGSNAGGDLAVWNVSTGTALTFAGNFAYDVDVDYKGALERLDITFDNVSVDSVSNITVSHNAKTVDLTSTGGGTNDIDGSVFGTQMRVLNVEGNTDLDTTAIAFDDNRAATINIGAMTGDTNIEVAAKNAVNYTSGATMTGAEKLTLTGDDLSGEVRLALDVDMGAGSNTLVLNAAASTTFVTGAIDGADDSVTLQIAGGNQIIDVTRVADVTAIGKVLFESAADVQMTSAQVNSIGIANFETLDFGNADGALFINDLGAAKLDLSTIDVGTVANLVTEDANGTVTLNSDTVLGNNAAGAASVAINAQTSDTTLQMTAVQFNQLAGVGTISAIEGNEAGTNQLFDAGLRITDMAAAGRNATIDLDEVAGTVDVTVVLNNLVATNDFVIATAADPQSVMLEISGTVDLTKATLTDVDGLVLVGGADLTITESQAAILFTNGAQTKISGAGNINIVDDGAANISVTINTGVAALGDVDMSGINITMKAADGAAATSTLVVTGTNDLVLKGVDTTADVTSFTLDAGAATGNVTVSGGSPAIALHEDTTSVRVESGSAGINLGTATDANNATFAGIQGNGLTGVTIDANNAKVVNVGRLETTSTTLTITAQNSDTDSPPVITFGDVPANAAWTTAGTQMKVVAPTTFGAGSELRINSSVIYDGDLTVAPIAGDSAPVFTKADTAAEMTAIMDKLDGANASAIVTGMDASQLNALAAKVSVIKANGLTGTLAITKDITSEDIAKLDGKYDGNAATVDATGMTETQLIAVADLALAANDAQNGNDKVAAGAIKNLTVTATTAAQDIADLLAKADGAVVNATSMDATDLGNVASAIASDSGSVASITGLTVINLTGGDDAAALQALFSKVSSATVNAASMSGTAGEDLSIVAQNIGKVSTLTNLTVTSGQDLSELDALLSKAAAGTASVNASTMTKDQLTVVSGKIAQVKTDGISSLALTKDQSAAEITTLLGKAGATTNVALTDLSAAQVTAVVGGVAKVDTVSGETTAAVLKQLDAAYGPTLNGDGSAKVTKISGSAAELKEVVIDAQAAGVNTINLPATVNLTVTDAAGTSLTSVQLSALNAAAGTVTVSNAVTITGTRAEVGTALVGGTAVVAAIALVTITDAAATALTATDLSAIGDKTTGTVTVSNAVKISGTQAQIEAAVITPETKVVAATANLEVTNVSATVVGGVSLLPNFAAIAATTSGTTTLNAVNGTNALNFTGYTGGDLIIVGGTGVDTITVTQGAHTLTGGANADVFIISGGTQTITDLGAGASADVVKLTGGTVSGTVTGDWTADNETVNQAASNASFVINVAGAHAVDMALASAGATDNGFTIKSTGTGAITGSGKADILENTSGSATFTGGSGNDTFIAKADTMTIAGGDLATGDILIAEGTGSITASGISTFVATTATSVTGTGTVTLAAATAGSTISVANAVGDNGFILTGGDGVDTITGSAKADVINASAGNDVVVGGEGDDTFKFTDALIEANSGTTATFNGGDGTDVVEITSATDGLIDADLRGFTNMEVLKFSAGDNTLTAGDNFNAAFGAIDITGAIDLAFTQGSAADIGTALAPLQIIGYTVNSAATSFNFLGTDAASDAALTDFTVVDGLYTDTDGTVADFFTKAAAAFDAGDVGMFHHSGNTYVFAEGSDGGAADDVYLEIVGVLLTSVSADHGALVLHII